MAVQSSVLRDRDYRRVAHGRHVKACERNVITLVLRLLEHEISSSTLTIDTEDLP
jgi:hypothetical protein